MELALKTLAVLVNSIVRGLVIRMPTLTLQ